MIDTTQKFQPNGAVCDRCQEQLTVYATHNARTGGYEYVCPSCMADHEQRQFNLQPEKGE